MKPYFPALVLALVNALLAIIATYAGLRAYDVLFTAQLNPATLIASAHIPMFWRLGVGAYVAGMVALAVFFASPRNLAASTRVTAVLVPIVAGLIAVQGTLLP